MFFGAGVQTDAFLIAFRIPNLFRRFFAEGAFTQAFVPALSNSNSKQQLIDNITGMLIFVLGLLTLVVMIVAPLVASAFAWGFVAQPEYLALTAAMIRISFWYLLCISLTALAAAILQVHQRFALPAITPILLNICIITAAVWLAPHLDVPIQALAWGVLCAGILQITVFLPTLHRLRLVPTPRLSFSHPPTVRVIKTMVPIIFSVSAVQISIAIDTAIATLLQEGSVTWLYFANRIVELPLGVFGISIATVLLPSLARCKSTDTAFTQTLSWGIGLSTCIALPAMVALFVTAESIVITVFMYANFSYADAIATAGALRLFAIGLPMFMLIKIFVSAFLSQNMPKPPVQYALIATSVGIVLSAVLSWKMGHYGLALAASITASINGGLLIIGMYRRGWLPKTPLLLKTLRICAALLAMAAALWWFQGPVYQWVQMEMLERLWMMAAQIMLGCTVYAGCMYALGWRMQRLAGPD